MTLMQSSFFDARKLETTDGVLLFMKKPRLTEDENLEQFDRDLITLTDTFQVRQIVLDMSEVVYMTSAAIGKLIALHRHLTRHEGLLILCSLQSEVADILGTSHLLTYFNVAETPTEASARLA